MNYFKAAEQILASLPLLERSLANLQARRDRLVKSGAPAELSAIDYEKPFTGSGYVNDTLNELLELSECVKEIQATESKIAEIHGVIDQLGDELRQVIVLWYIERRSKESIAEELCKASVTTIYNLRNRAVAEFALLYYGAAALPSI